MNINSIITKDYRKKDDFVVRINKPNSNPISETPKMDVSLYVIEYYENERLCRRGENKPNFRQEMPKGNRGVGAVRGLNHCIVKVTRANLLFMFISA